MVLNNTNKNISILLEVLDLVFTVSANFPDNLRTFTVRKTYVKRKLENLR